VVLVEQEPSLEHLDKQVSDCAKQESDLVQKSEYLERRIKSQRQNMEELIATASSSAALLSTKTDHRHSSSKQHLLSINTLKCVGP
jgi:hypothetical protein